MAGRGPTPKDPEKRQRRNADPVEAVELDERSPDDDIETPPMPECPAGEWHPSTTRWWDRWAGSQQAALFIDTDWMVLELMVPLVEAYARGNLALATEIRLQHAKLGATPEDRLRLRWSMRRRDLGAEAAEREREKVAAAGGGAVTSSRAKPDPRLTVVQGGKGA